MSAMLISVFGGVIALVLVGTALFAVLRRSTQRRRWYEIAILLASPLLVASILFTNWPMKLSFTASRPALDRLAEQVVAGQTPALPTRAGAYIIHAVETRAVSGGQAICLWTAPLKRQHVGFVQSPAGVTPHVNPWTHTQLTTRWHHFAED